jgi:tetratricopeptide (TPR) repeat protein
MTMGRKPVPREGTGTRLPVKAHPRKPLTSPDLPPPTAASPRRCISLILALLTLVIYLPTRQHGFSVYDDGDYITQNRMVQSGLTWAGFQWAFTTWWASNWHPLTWLSHMADCQWFGLDAGAHHLVNVLFHAGNAVLLFLLLCRLTGTMWGAALVAALFAWHPLRVESVAWAAERKDVLSCFFELLSLSSYVRYARAKQRRDFYLALVFFAMALLAKPMPVTLPFLLLVLDWWPLRRLANVTSLAGKWARLAGEKWPFFLLSAASCCVTYLAQRTTALPSIEQYPLSLRLGNALLAYAKYLLKILWPVDLAVIYPLPGQLSWPLVTAVGAGLAGVSWIAWRMRRAHPFLLAGWFWYLGTLVPVIGLVQAGKQAMADRYSYFPCIGIFLAAVLAGKGLAARFQLRWQLLAAGAGLVLAINVWFTEYQLDYWRDDVSLFSHAVAVTGDNPGAQINLGLALEQQGRRDAALVHYREALRLAPDSVEAHNNLANTLNDEGQTREALDHYLAALQLDPNEPITHCNLGTLLLNLGRFEEAIQQYQAAERLQPEDPHVHYLMGKAWLRQGRTSEAIAQFRQALRLDSNDFQTLTFLARILAADENPANRDGRAAVELAERANTLTAGTQPYILDVLAMAYAESGRANDAQRIEVKARELADAGGAPGLVADIQRHLQLFQVGQPCREVFTNLSPAE